MTETHPSPYEEMKRLNDEILYYNDLHHNKDIQEISDAEFDQKQQRFEELSEIYPDVAKMFALQINKPVALHELENQGLELVTFTEPMLSLKKALEWQHLDRWMRAFPADTNFVYELKLDGLALELQYRDHKLVRMCTRGDGLIGEDVTHALPLFSNIPTTLPTHLPGDFIVRGEGVINLRAFEGYNEATERPRATPRNAVSGWVRALEKNQDKAVLGLLHFYIYWSSTDLGAEDYHHLRDKWYDAGFWPVLTTTLVAIKLNVRHWSWPTDGIVVKLNSFAQREKVGVTHKHPNWAIAYKFPFQEAETSIEDVSWHTGKTGRVTPVVQYAPVTIGGVVCRRASLDNYHQFMALQLREDSIIAVTRNGDVIPRIDRVVEQGVGERFKGPGECPSCGGALRIKLSPSSSSLYCDNVSSCPSQTLNRCLSLVHRNCLDIEDLGPVTLEYLVELKTISRPADIFILPKRAVSDKVRERIERAKVQPLHRIIKALGLPGVDVIRAKKIARAMVLQGMQLTGEDIIHWLCNVDNIKRVSGFGNILALPIASAMEKGAVRRNAEALFEHLQVSTEELIEPDFKVCITGELDQTRDELAAYFAEQGIELVDTLTKDCQALIVGQKPGKAKLSKATALGIFMVTASKASSVDNLIEQIKNRN